MYFLGIDTSTTSSKALLINEEGELLAIASHPHTLNTPKPRWSEQNPQEWWDAVTKSIKTVLKKAGISGKHVTAIGLTGQMHGLVMLDEDGEPLRPAILWNDQRTQKQCDEIHQRIGKDKFVQISGNIALTGFTAPKILWVKETEPEVFGKTKHILLPKDYIRYKLTGEYAMDKAGGSGTVLFDLKARDWSAEILSSLGIPIEWMPKTYEGTQFTGQVSEQAASITGLAAGTPVAAGGGDQSTAAVGFGAIEPGIVGLTLGTSGVIFATTPSAMIEPQGRLHAFCHAVPKLWHFMGVMLSAAGSLQWYHDTLAPETSFETLLHEAASIPAGSEGLQFLPYLTGERTPHPDPLARGAFIGLTIRHNRGHMTRAVLEGVAFGLKDSFSLVQSAGLDEIKEVRASGGGIKSQLWRQIIASVLDLDIYTVNTTESSAYGAALLAGVGAGTWNNATEACHAAIEITDKTSPAPKDVYTYQKSYQIYQELYPLLQSTFTKM